MKIIAFVFLFCFGVNLFSQTVQVKTDLVYKVNLPLKKSEKAPVIILLHGYGSNESDLFDIAKSFDDRFITFSLRAPLAANGGQGYSWFGLEFLPDKKFNYNYNEAKESRSKILSFVSNACRSYNADSTQVFIMGYSQGAIIAYDIIFSKPEKIKGVVALSGFLLDETKKMNIDFVKLAKLKFFIAHGNMDNVIDFKEGEKAFTFLEGKKMNAIFKTYEIPHSINGKELNDIKAWLQSNIQKEKKEVNKK